MPSFMFVVVLVSSASLVGCVSPSERVPVNRSVGGSSWFGDRRQSMFLAHPAVRQPEGFLPTRASEVARVGTPSRAGSEPATTDGSIARLNSTDRQGLPSFFPGLFERDRGMVDRLAIARSRATADSVRSVRPEFDDGGSRVASVQPRPNQRRFELPADTSVQETAAEFEHPFRSNAGISTDDGPLLSVALDVRAYPVERTEAPVPEIAAADSAEQPAIAAEQLRSITGSPSIERFSTGEPEADAVAEEEIGQGVEDRGSSLLAIPGVDSPTQPTLQGRQTPTRDEIIQSAGKETPIGRSEARDTRGHESGTRSGGPKATSAPHDHGAASSNLASSERFRVTPRAGAASEPSIFEVVRDSPKPGFLNRIRRRFRGGN